MQQRLAASSDEPLGPLGDLRSPADFFFNTPGEEPGKKRPGPTGPCAESGAQFVPPRPSMLPTSPSNGRPIEGKRLAPPCEGSPARVLWCVFGSKMGTGADQNEAKTG